MKMVEKYTHYTYLPIELGVKYLGRVQLVRDK